MSAQPPTARAPRPAERRFAPGKLIVPGVVVAGLAIVLGPALVGRGVLLDVNSLSGRLPFRAVTGAVFGDTITCRQDTIDYFPAIAQIKASLFAGQLPTWAPYEVGGAPLAALPNTGYLSPLALPYFVLPLWLAPAFVKLGEVVVALVGTILFLRRRGVSVGGSWLAGFVFVTSGFMIAWSNWPQTRVAALIPLLLWATDRVVERHRARDAVILACVFAAMLLGGFPAVTLYALVAAGVFALVRAWARYRGRFAESIGALGTAVAGLALGAGLAAVQLVPFVLSLSAAFSGRDKGGWSLPLGAAVTLFDPSARGDCAGGVWFGEVIPIEAIGYVGSAALVLAVMAMGFRRRGREESGTRAWLIGSVLVAGVLIWVGGPLLSLWERIPVVGNNSITRAQSVVGFLLACLAGLGFDRLTRRSSGGADDADADRAPETGKAARPGWLRPTVVGTAALLVLLVITAAAVAEARSGGYLEHLTGSLVVPILLLLAALAVVVLVFLGPARFAAWGPLAMVVLVVAQGTVFAHSMLPLSTRELLYPTTPTHEFLQANLGRSRYGAGDRTMDAAISDWYHLRTPTGHEFTDARWKSLLADVDPQVQRTVTYSAFSPSLPFADMAESRILDRLAVRYWTASPRRGGLGETERVSDSGRVELSESQPATCRIDGGPLRGVRFRVAEQMPTPVAGTTTELRVRVSAGGQVRTGAVLLEGAALDPGPVSVAVAGEDLPAGGPADVEVSVSGTDEPRFLSGTGRRVACAAVRPDDADRVRLVFADAGSAIFERLDALPRIRWASRSRVVAVDKQVAALRRGISADTVLLDDDDTPAAGNGTGSVQVLTDDAERIAVATESSAQGYLVVADSLVRAGWTATVDGRSAALVRGDHAFAAVPVPSGRHQVELRYTAPGLQVGAVISALALLVSAAAVAAPVLLRRRRRAAGRPRPAPRR